jgi:hypothetical protein
MTRLLSGPHRVADKHLWTFGVTVAVLDGPRPDPKIVVWRRHERKSAQFALRWRFEC